MLTSCQASEADRTRYRDVCRMLTLASLARSLESEDGFLVWMRRSEAVTMMLRNKLTVDLYSSKQEINTLTRNILSVGGNQTLR